MVNFIIGLIIGAIAGYGVCAILSANGRVCVIIAKISHMADLA